MRWILLLVLLFSLNAKADPDCSGIRVISYNLKQPLSRALGEATNLHQGLIITGDFECERLGQCLLEVLIKEDGQQQFMCIGKEDR